MKFRKLIVLVFALLTSPSISFAQTDIQENSDLLIRTGNFQEAINNLDLYIENYPNDAKAYINRAIAHGYLGQIEERNRDLRYAKYLNPFALMYISEFDRSMNYEKKKYGYNFSQLEGEFNKSPVNNKYYQSYLSKVVKQHAQDSLLTKAIYFLSVNEIDSTRETLSKIKDEENILGIIYDIQGVIALKANDLDGAIRYFSKSIEEMPEFALAYHNRAIAYKLEGDYEAANVDLERALALNEEVSVFYFTLAKLSELVSDDDAARSYYQKALDKNPNYLEARTNYSLLQKTLGNYEEALSNLEAIVREEDRGADVSYLRGGIHLTYGEYEKAIAEFDSYLSENVGDDRAIFNRGMAKILQGKISDGCIDVEYSIDLTFQLNREEIYKAFCE